MLSGVYYDFMQPWPFHDECLTGSDLLKKVLIFGAGSYIGDSFTQYVQGRLDVTAVDSTNDLWNEIDFCCFDSVVYLAGIAHRKQSESGSALYFAVNRDLAFSAACKAKADGVAQFVYFSSLYAFGVTKGEITGSDFSAPEDPYGLSKFEAEQQLRTLQSETFKIAVIRPPMVYGPGCRGNFPQLVRITKTSPFIPTKKNKRSMIFIDNLAEFLAIVIEERAEGLLCPQNKEYVATSKLMEEIAKSIGKKSIRTPVLNLFIHALSPLSSSLRSAFGSLYYGADVSRVPFVREYQLVGFEESVRKSV